MDPMETQYGPQNRLSMANVTLIDGRLIVHFLKADKDPFVGRNISSIRNFSNLLINVIFDMEDVIVEVVRNRQKV